MTARRHYGWLQDALARDATVISASRRLARELVAEHDAQQVAQGKLAWETPQILFLHDWLCRSIDELPDAGLPRLIDSASSVVLWERCLDRTVRNALLSTTGLVRHAMRAWQRVHEWQVPLERLAATAASRDEHWFARAAAAYAEELNQAQWLDAAQLPMYCAELFASGRLAAPAQIVYAGFDRLTPATAALFEQLAAQGSQVVAAAEGKVASQPNLHAHADAAAMWRAAGRWARDTLEREPGARVAVIVPDLETDAVSITRLVREGFAPGWQLGGARHRTSVDVSYGMPLAAYPAIGVALSVLRLAANGLSSGDVSILLRTPFTGDIDAAGRSRLDLFLRSIPDRHWLPSTLLDALRGAGKDRDGADWCERFGAVEQLHDERSQLRSPAAWARQIDEVLTQVGWPGTAAPDSAEFQLLNRWRQLLNALAQLEAVRPRCTLAEAVSRLQQLASDTVYQPEVEGGGLRILGMLEAAGLEFDQLWIGALDASRWPPVSQPLALVNRRLQRETGMPDSSPADTLEFARRTLQRLQAAATCVEMSWARLEGDKELIPSPLLHTESQQEFADAGDPGWHAAAYLGASRQVIYPDEAPRVEHGEVISGGAYTVQSMREEPFTAFANGRLHTRELERFAAGLTPLQRGNVVHDALHHLLRDRPTQADIQGWSEEARAERIAAAAWRPLAKHWAQADPVLQRLLRMEQQRLRHLLAAFLDKECARDAFAVEGVEVRTVLQHGPVRLDLRIDRLDRLADTSLLIIDYKSGEKKPFMSTKRKAPAHLQLCVYARALDDAVGGLTLLFVDSREIVYIGDGGSVAWGKTDVEAWAAVLEEWCHEVDVLLTRFAAGDIGVNSEQKHADARPLAVLSRFAELHHAD